MVVALSRGPARGRGWPRRSAGAIRWILALSLLLAVPASPAAAQSEQTAFELWRAFTDSSVGVGSANVYAYSDYARALAVDAQGDLHVAGVSRGPLSGYPTDEEVRVRFSAQGAVTPSTAGIAAGPAGRLVVTERAYGSIRVAQGSGGAIYTSKSGPDGWGVTLAHPVDEVVGQYPDDWPVGLALDPSGDVTIAGEYRTGRRGSSGGSPRTVVARYRGRDGAELWKAWWGENGVPRAMVLDERGNVYVTGTAGTVKYTSDGQLACTCPAQGERVALDPGGGFYVAGPISTQGRDPTTFAPYWHLDANVVKYDEACNPVWSASYARAYDDTVTHLAVAGDGSAHLVARNEQQGMAVVKFDPGGAMLWAAEAWGAYPLDLIKHEGELGELYVAYGKTRWRNTLDLTAPRIGFYAMADDDKLALIEGFLARSFAHAASLHD